MSDDGRELDAQAELLLHYRVLLWKNYHDREIFVAQASCLLSLQTGSRRHVEIIDQNGDLHLKTYHEQATHEHKRH